jgi:hypothetical protein
MLKGTNPHFSLGVPTTARPNLCVPFQSTQSIFSLDPLSILPTSSAIIASRRKNSESAKALQRELEVEVVERGVRGIGNLVGVWKRFIQMDRIYDAQFAPLWKGVIRLDE